MTTKTVLTEFNDLAKTEGLPVNVYEDTTNRVTDWLSSGGAEDAPYVKSQLDYLKKVIRVLNL